ncbi:glucose-6-phosphate dehydrogenase assembly protein OpcA [Nonomuraea gerenzanensis]|uniref:OpcA, an allosteric effector of glucose-6-phosphate dehydrogenase, actinobacterial n=1 Tax=Nonomuraea gerenzanensis TaxID=93944 RepID=A0A1M4EHG5_9ACTN|nr:glucose-6-phosphate dehydrogenase assembly protein OpcA [Nonomuraea gerenzanensis]UBU09762.1 glucose-6-phosphate dehydrogenase assembly protein OpcA [Nonomuraea gerenzanensis]SBO98204.1 OpcA, an allosteric effector of glucose-6-phosphate dehydrogenase, actinobacterial [Nonomuraea gerenzanensis]
MTTFMLTDTTAGKIAAQLTHLRHQMGAPAIGMVLTLVVVSEERHQYDALRAATEAAREHPSRIIIVIKREPEEAIRLDAELRIGENTPGEVVVLRLYGELTEHADSVVSPLLLPDTPVVAWWPGAAPDAPAKDAIGALAQRRITDAKGFDDGGVKSLVTRAKGYARGDTDLAWARLTPWRSLLAAAFDQPVGKVRKGTVEASAGHPSAPLLAAWLSERLGAPIRVVDSPGPGLTAVRLQLGDGELAVVRTDARLATLSRPGQPDRNVALARRQTSELMAEELRRLDTDEIYEAAVKRFARTYKG